jgi:hypothetical protein
MYCFVRPMVTTETGHPLASLLAFAVFVAMMWNEASVCQYTERAFRLSTELFASGGEDHDSGKRAG